MFTMERAEDISKVTSPIVLSDDEDMVISLLSTSPMPSFDDSPLIDKHQEISKEPLTRMFKGDVTTISLISPSPVPSLNDSNTSQGKTENSTFATDNTQGINKDPPNCLLKDQDVISLISPSPMPHCDDSKTSEQQSEIRAIVMDKPYEIPNKPPTRLFEDQDISICSLSTTPMTFSANTKTSKTLNEWCNNSEETTMDMVQAMLSSASNDCMNIDENDYTKIKVLGSGAYGSVHLAKCKESNAHVALKTICNQYTISVQNEMLLFDLDHENIIKLHGMTKPNEDKQILVLEPAKYCLGKLLYIQKYRFSLSSTKAISQQLLQGLDYL